MGLSAPHRSINIEEMKKGGGSEQDRKGRLEGGRETASQEGAGEGAEKKPPSWVMRSLQSSRGGGRRVEAGSRRLRPPVALGSHLPPRSLLLPPTSLQLPN